MPGSGSSSAQPAGRTPSPMEDLLGIELIDIGEERAGLRLSTQPSIANRQGGLHGGAVASLIDIAAATAAQYGDGQGLRRNGTVSMTVQFLETVSEGSVVAQATVLRRGRALCVCEVKVLDDDLQLVATALVTHRLDSSLTQERGGVRGLS